MISEEQYGRQEAILDLLSLEIEWGEPVDNVTVDMLRDVSDRPYSLLYFGKQYGFLKYIGTIKTIYNDDEFPNMKVFKVILPKGCWVKEVNNKEGKFKFYIPRLSH